MVEKTAKEMTKELHQAVIGLPDNPEENGLIGDVKDIRGKLDVVNGKTRKNEVRSKVNQAILAVLLGGSGITAGVTKLIDLW